MPDPEPEWVPEPDPEWVPDPDPELVAVWEPVSALPVWKVMVLGGALPVPPDEEPEEVPVSDMAFAPMTAREWTDEVARGV